MQAETPITRLPGVGPTVAGHLKRLNINTVRDLLFYFPFRYEDYSSVSLIRDLVPGELVTIAVKIEMIAAKRSARRRAILTEAVVTDASDRLRVVWFNQPYLAKTLAVGDSVYLSGKVVVDRFGISLSNPSYERIKPETVHTARLVPLYPLTAGLTQKQLRKLVNEVLSVADTLPEWIPNELLARVQLQNFAASVRAIHFPADQTELDQALKRLKFDELFLLQVRAEMVRQELVRLKAPKIPFVAAAIKDFVARLPYELTTDQRVAAWEIFQDLSKPQPMNRLLEGDVGSGKTVVAALALFLAIKNKFQGALMAPTEILAQQHFATISELLAPYHITVALLTHRTVAKKADRTALHTGLRTGKIRLVIGTQALLSAGVEFQNLGLVIVDEQHRFGVAQRKTIKYKTGLKNQEPHFLSMTATPIPRSLALTLYGDLDISQLRAKPAGRLPIKTKIVAPHQREQAYAFVREQVKKGRQAFVICPLIEEKAEATAGTAATKERKSVLVEYEKLSTKIFPDLRVGWLHGKMPAADKDATMQAFAAGNIDILVSTSVVEVGVNIPNASVMMIEGAEAFGLAQLHQFRGRVGRSEWQSFCLVFSDSTTTATKDRLAFFEKNTDGFALAEFDLETRGPGEVYGQSQSGVMQLKLATLQDTMLIKQARELARDLNFKQYPTLVKAVKQWETETHRE